MALLSWRQPHSEAEAKGGREAGYLSTMRSRWRFFCLSWLFLPACNLRLAWPLSSWLLRAPMGTEGHSHLAAPGQGRTSGLWLDHPPSTPEGPL